jgi:hypothetical protein
MSTEKVSFTLDRTLLAEAREVSGTRALSSYVNRALRNQLQHDRVASFLAESDLEHGPVDAAILDEVRKEWPGE